MRCITVVELARLDAPPQVVDPPSLPDAHIGGQHHQVAIRFAGGDHLHQRPVNPALLKEAPELPGLDGFEPDVRPQFIHDGICANPNDTTDAAFPQEGEPVLPKEFPVCNQRLPAFRWKALQQSGDQAFARGRITAAPMRKSDPDEREGESFQHDTENEQVERGLAGVPVGAVDGQHLLPLGKQGDQEGQPARVQLLILQTACQTLAFGFCGTRAGKPIGEPLLVGGLLLDQGTDDVRDTLQRVNAQGRVPLLQEVAKLGRLKAGSF